MATKLRRGNLNPDADNGLSFSTNSSGTKITVSDSSVDYSAYSATITNPKKKFLLTDNDIENGGLSQSLVYESSDSETSATAWSYDNYQDGWYTPMLIYVQGYTNAIPSSVNIYDGVVIWYENGSNDTDTNFYRALQDGVTVKPNEDTTGENWTVAEYSDYINFMKLVDARAGAGQSFLGEYGSQQDQTLSYLERKLNEYSVEAAKKVIEMPSYKPCDDGTVTKHSILDTMKKSASYLFCQERIYDSQEVVQEAIYFTEDPSRRGICGTC